MEQSSANLIQSILAMRQMLGPIALQMVEDALEQRISGSVRQEQ